MSLIAAITIFAALQSQLAVNAVDEPPPTDDVVPRIELEDIEPTATGKISIPVDPDATIGDAGSLRSSPGNATSRGAARGRTNGPLRIPLTGAKRPGPVEEVDERNDDDEALPRLGEGLWAASWAEVPGSHRWITPMVWIRGNGVADTSWTSNRYFRPEVVAAELASRPPGRRVLFVWRYRHSLLGHPFDRIRAPDGGQLTEPGPIVNAASSAILGEWEPFVERLHQLGPDPDYLILDIESAGDFKSWNLEEDSIESILADPRFETMDLGDGDRPRSMMGEWTASQVHRKQPPEAAADFNATIDRIFATMMNRSILGPALARWPGIRSSNYGGFRVDPVHATPDMNASRIWGNAAVGTHSGLEFYGRLRNICTYYGPHPTDPTRIARTGAGRFVPDGFLAMKLDLNRARALRRTDDRDHHSWIATPDWRSDGISTSYYEKSPYWIENVFQQAIAGTSLILFWNPMREESPTPEELEARARHAGALEDALAELDRRTRGACPLDPIDSSRLDWTSDWVLGGAELPDGSRLWRVTTAPGVRSVQVKVGGAQTSIGIDDEPGAWIISGRGQAVEVTGVSRD